MYFAQILLDIVRKPLSSPDFIVKRMSGIYLVKDTTLQGICGKDDPKGLLFYCWPSCLEFPSSKNIFLGKPKQCAKINTPKGNELELTFAASCSLFPAIWEAFSKMALIHLWSCYQSQGWFPAREIWEWGAQGFEQNGGFGKLRLEAPHTKEHIWYESTSMRF